MDHGCKSEPDRIVDPGLQAERTRLSWNRTALAIGVNAALLLHTGRGSLATQLSALLMLGVAVGCWLFAARRYRQITAAIRTGQSVAVLAQIRTLARIRFLPAAIGLAAVLSLDPPQLR